ncbi:MAG: TIM barrel protein [Zavarzinella sp.]
MNPLSRRDFIVTGAALGAASTLVGQDLPTKAIVHGKIKQSVCSWCFTGNGSKWSLDQLCQITVKLGCPSVELLSPDAFPTLKKHGLTCAMTSNTMPGGFRRGFNNLKHREELTTRTKKVIDAAAEFGSPSVIAFTGMEWIDPEDPKSGTISRDEGAKNCVAGLNEIAGYAEKKKVTVCLEHLNTRDDSHPMKGHPGYQGDDLDYCVDILKAVGSPRVKLLFDIYHVQVMHGDVIRRLAQNKEWIGHIHTAGNPGRGELDENQEIFYPAVMRQLLKNGYTGFVGQEFIPTRDALSGLTAALKWCDVSE